jgi:BolA family transcriptional regulator, general stress-responsive regulator
MNTTERIRELLARTLAPAHLEVIDESGKHAGHAGAVPGKTTHVRVVIASNAFAGLNRLERHRKVNALLAGEIAAGLHALAIEAKAPGE